MLAIYAQWSVTYKAKQKHLGAKVMRLNRAEII